jgi:hypothetical protein
MDKKIERVEKLFRQYVFARLVEELNGEQVEKIQKQKCRSMDKMIKVLEKQVPDLKEKLNKYAKEFLNE